MNRKVFTLDEEDLVVLICDYVDCHLGSVEADHVRRYVRGLTDYFSMKHGRFF